MKIIFCSKFRIINSLFIIILFPVFSFSQDTTSVVPKLPPAHVGFIREDIIEQFGTDSVEAIDSSLSSFYHFDKFLYNLTNEKNVFNESENDFAVRNIVNFSNDITSPYKFSGRTIKYYKLNRRFTEVTYLSGRKKEQLLNIIYSQNLARGWNAGLDFRRSGALGFFRRQLYYQSSFDVFTHYETPNKRYNLSAYYLRNHLEQEENGGVIDFNPAENTFAQPTYLSSAENKQTDKEFLLRQSIQLNKAKEDSLSPAKSKLILGHVVRWETKGKMYSESSIDSFYQNNYLSQAATNDSIWYQRWNNRIFGLWQKDVSFLNIKRISIYYGIGHEYFIFKSDSFQLVNEGAINQRESVYSEFCADINSDRNISMNIYIRAAKQNSRRDSLPVKAVVSVKLLDGEDQYFFSETIERRLPDITDRFFVSNHFEWFNDFALEEITRFAGGISNLKYSFVFSGEYKMTKNFIYNSSSGIPAQHTGTLNYYCVTLKKDFTLGNWHFDHKILWQQSGNESVIHLPEWSTGHSLYFEKLLFKKATLARFGTDVHFVSSYFADRYMPATQKFYLQNSEKTGGFALVDLYINFRVKASLFFIKAENLLSGVSDKAYFYRPDYPITPRVIRFGLQFRFFD